jgi:hypothetical protein
VVQVDGIRLGVRTNTLEADEVLAGLLGPSLVNDARFEPNYSVVISPPAERGRPRGLHLLYRSSQIVVRSLDAKRVWRALLSFLSSHADLDNPGQLHCRMIGLVRDGRAVLVPARLRAYSDVGAVERALARARLQVTDTPFCTIDPANGELFVPEPAFGVNWNVLDRVEADRDKSPGAVPPGRYQILGWIFHQPPGSAPEVSRAAGLVMAIQSLIAPSSPGTQILNALAASIATGSVAAMPSSPDELISRAAELLL